MPRKRKGGARFFTPKKRRKTQEPDEGDSQQDHTYKKTLEEGHIYFFYRPKVDVEIPKSASHASHLYFILSPLSTLENDKLVEKKDLTKRLLIMTSKKFPDPRTHTRHWAFVDGVSSRLEELHQSLGSKTYKTKTRGERYLQAARPCGEGRYSFIENEEKKTVALAYVLEVPTEPSNVQKAFNIKKEASYVTMVKNPGITANRYGNAPPGLRSKQKAQFPRHLQEKFEGKVKSQLRFVPANPPDFLNIDHCEIVVIGMRENLTEQFGNAGKQLVEQSAEEIELAKKEFGSRLEEKVMQELGVPSTEKEQAPIDALKGTWA